MKTKIYKTNTHRRLPWYWEAYQDGYLVACGNAPTKLGAKDIAATAKLHYRGRRIRK